MKAEQHAGQMAQILQQFADEFGAAIARDEPIDGADAVDFLARHIPRAQIALASWRGHTAPRPEQRSLL